MKKASKNALFLCLLATIFATGYSHAQPLNGSRIKALIPAFKIDPRGPYQAIRWFCPDGTILPANQRCSQAGGIQHALLKDIVRRIADEQGIFLGQILAGTGFEDFFDAGRQNSRLKQYQMEKYLQVVDDGWIVHQARFYRGAVQAEDEENWGLEFLTWLLSREETITSQFFLLRQVSKDIPHGANDDRLLRIRSLSKTIADSLPDFMAIRVKIHGHPDASDPVRVREFLAHNRNRISGKIRTQIESLAKELESVFQPIDLRSLNKYLAGMPSQSPLTAALHGLAQTYGLDESGHKRNINRPEECGQIADLLWLIRLQLLTLKSHPTRLAMIDLSNELENILFREISSWKPGTLAELMQKDYVLAKAVAGCGYLEIWEWQTIEPFLRPGSGDFEAINDFLQRIFYTRGAIEWSTGMFRAVYAPVIQLFSDFEPLAAGFLDEKIRSSLLLPFGDVAWHLGDIADKMTKKSNEVMGLKNLAQVRGLNPGFAFGELKVLTDLPERQEFSADKIYILSKTPPDLKPVAGIATITEGNLVSHVQLLARNLGIPNAVLSQQNLIDLLPYSGTNVFYAVSRRGTVVMKPAALMTAEEKALVTEKKPQQQRIRVPTDEINLDMRRILSLRELRSRDSGRICGPKAANLGELKRLFPENVVDGLVIPFGLFRAHLEQEMSTGNATYWQFLEETFEQAAMQRRRGAGEQEVEAFTLKRLSQLRDEIQNMPLLPSFRTELKARFNQIFGANLGELGVFIRSDTNMEDLKDFSGAGLNLTVFNVVSAEKILQGIRQVWASPYTERSYRWRQKYLLNPENVYPSILVQPAVNVEKSGVAITTSLLTSAPDDVTIAFNRGVGGAVEGQAAESFLLSAEGTNYLLSPSRQTTYTSVPPAGDTRMNIAFSDHRILTNADFAKLRALVSQVKQKLPSVPRFESSGPFDMEIGFQDNKLWLFQVRPYVENKRAQGSGYLQRLDPQVPQNVKLALGQKLRELIHWQ